MTAKSHEAAGGQSGAAGSAAPLPPLRPGGGPVMPHIGSGGGPPGRGMMMPKVRAKNAGATLRRIWRYLGCQRGGLIAVLAATIASTLLGLAGPYLIGHAVDHYIIPQDYDGLVSLCLLLVAVYAGHALFTWIQTYVMVGLSQRTVRDMRRDLFARLQQLPLSFFDRRTHGELMSRTTNDIENVSATLNQSVTQLLSSVLMLAGSLGFMLALDLWLTLVSLVTVPLVILLTRFIAAGTRKYFAGQQQKLGELNGFIEETVSGQKVVQIYRRESAAAAQFDALNTELRGVGIRAQIYSGLVGPVMNVLNNFGFALIAAVGGWMAYRNWTTIGTIVIFMNYSKQFQRPLNELANQFNLLQSAVAGAERVFEILDTDTEYAETEKHAASEGLKGEVRFENVTFSYKEGVTVLRNVSLVARPGETIALVGPTGAGKTTIINLLTRFYDIDSGRITIDGTDIRDMDKNKLRSQLGLVLQDAYVFSGTIRDNIRYGKLEATDAEVEAAARLANADAFIRKLPLGYDTPLTGGGGNISQGQRQLITIARAILADPAILILDEATSSIDTRTEMHIQEAMRKLMSGRTSFVIAHRLSTIREADQILVVHGGEIIERGTHAELLEKRGFYRDLYISQFERTG